MTPLAVAVQVAAATVLAVAAAAKLGAPRGLRATLAELGVPGAEVVRWLVPAAELAVAVALVSAPAAPATRATVLAVGLAFAGAGARALVRGARVTCACFGGGRGAPLGVRQLVALPVWALAALLPARAATPLAGSEGLVVLAGAVVAVAAARAVVVSGWAREGRAFRAGLVR